MELGTYEVKLVYRYTFEGNPLDRTSATAIVLIEDVFMKATWIESETKGIITPEGKNAIQLSWFVNPWGTKNPIDLQIIVRDSNNTYLSTATVTLPIIDDSYVLDDLYNINDTSSVLLNNNTTYNIKIRKRFTNGKDDTDTISITTLDYPIPVINSYNTSWNGSTGTVILSYDVSSSPTDVTILYRTTGITAWNTNVGDTISGLSEGNYDIKIVFTYTFEGISFERFTETSAIISKFMDYEPVLSKQLDTTRTINVAPFTSDISTIKYTWSLDGEIIHTDSEYAIKCATTYGAKMEKLLPMHKEERQVPKFLLGN